VGRKTAILVLLAAGCALVPSSRERASTRATVPGLLLADDAPRFLVCGHRGDYFGGKHNTLDSFQQALRHGADLVEADVEATADGVLVIEHDAWPRTKQYAECDDLLTLRALLGWAEGRTVVVLDVKTDRIPAVVGAVRTAAAVDRVLFYGEDEPEYRAMRAQGDDLYVMVRAREAAGLRAWLRLDDPRAVVVQGDVAWLTPGLVAEVHATGRRVWANSYRGTFGHELFGARRSAAETFAKGIDIAQTNNPARAADARAEALAR
jgi:hypothetical protein